MDEPAIHSESWIGPPQPPTPDWYWRIFPRALTREEVRAAQADARKMTRSRAIGIAASGAWMVGGALLHFSTRLSGWMVPAIPIDVPPVWLFSFTSIFGVVLFIRAASRDLSPRVIRASSLFGATLFVFALLLPPLTIYSYTHAEEGPKRRMQFVSQDQGDAEGAIFA